MRTLLFNLHVSYRYAFLISIAHSALLLGVCSAGSHAGEVAILKSSDVPYYDEAIQGFRAMLPPRTTVKEHNLGGNVQLGRKIGQSLRATPPSLVFAVGLKAALVAKLELPDLPVLFALVLDPESHGLPTANMTGIRMRVSANRQLTTMHLVLPQVQRIGILYDENRSEAFLAEARRSAQILGLELLPMAVRSSKDVPDAFRALLPKIQALWLTQDRTVVTEASVPYLIQTTLDAKIPLFTFSSTLVQQGAVGGLVVQAWEVGQQAASVAGHVLRDEYVTGAQLLDPEHPQLALNLHTAEYLGLSPSTEVVRLATVLYGPGTVAKQSSVNDLVP